MILGNIRDGLMLVDLEGRIVYANDALADMLGRPASELLGADCRSVFRGNEGAEMHPDALGDLADGPIAHFNVSLTRADGEAGAYCFMASPVQNERGETVAILQNFRGMDRLMEVILGLEQVNAVIRAEKERTEEIVNSIGDGVYTLDRELLIQSFSPKMVEITGIRAEHAIGRPCATVLGGSKCATDCPLAWTLDREQAVEGCREALTASDGRRIPVTITTSLLRDRGGETIGLTAVVGDLSEVERQRSELRERFSFRQIVGSSRAMREVFDLIEAVSNTDATVLVTGESGTGKELVARAIHYGSARADQPFVVVNCAALNDTLLESELFGHVRGAFTGADRDKRGRFEAAAGGTIFLDEVGDTSSAMQAKLLRVLQDRSFERVGSSETRTVDVRVLAATNRDLAAATVEGTFREDLFYRLNVVPIPVPPLRERAEDIPILVEHFLQRFLPKYRGEAADSFEGLSTRALARLTEYAWPGNVRELQHSIEYALISSRSDRIERTHLPAAVRDAPEDTEDRSLRTRPVGSTDTKADADQGDTLRGELERHRWNVSRTAQALGISRTTLWRRMKKHGLAGPQS